MNTKNMETLRDIKENLDLIKNEGTRKFAEKIFSTPDIDLDTDLDTYVKYDYVVKNIDLRGEIKEVEVVFNNFISAGPLFETDFTYRDIFEQEMNYDDFADYYIDTFRDCLFTLSDLDEEQENILENAEVIAKYSLENSNLLYVKVLEKDNQKYLYANVLVEYFNRFYLRKEYRSEVLIKIDEDDAEELINLIENEGDKKICEKIFELINAEKYFCDISEKVYDNIMNEEV